MKLIWVATAALCVGLLIGGVAPGRTVAPAATEESLMAADRAFDAATAARKMEGFSSFLAENVRTLRADKPVISGKAAVQQTWKPLLDNKTLSLRWKPISAELSNSGDLGYTVGTFMLTQTDEKGSRVAQTGKYLTVWRVQKDGSWKVEFDTGVPDSDPSTPRQ
jgi:ketosteroid isomerase-like protein